jgi:hypothetical protein
MPEVKKSLDDVRNEIRGLRVEVAKTREELLRTQGKKQ